MLYKIKTIILILLPHHLFSRFIQWSARCPGFPFRLLITRWFIRRYNVNMSEAINPDPNVYPDFNHFFTRALRPEVRPIAHAPGEICSPADSTISQIGKIQGEKIFQAKGHWFSPNALLGGDEERARTYQNGAFATMYLSPRDYHRVHMPLSGQLVETVYIPGRLYSVSPVYTERVPMLFAKNERFVSIFQTEAGLMAVVLVGALFVGSIETVWAGEITPPQGRGIKVTRYTSDPDTVIQLKRGEEMGRFNMGGSTVIVLFESESMEWKSGLAPEVRVHFGEAVGRVLR